MNLAPIRFRAAFSIPATAVVLSLSLSALALVRDPVINTDGILYLRAAAAFRDGGWGAAWALYPWPFYSALIAAAHRVTGLSLEHSAHLLNALFYAISTCAFVTLVRHLGGPRIALLVFASLAILIHPELNDYRSFVIRDAGYWAFYLVSILFLFRFAQSERLSDAVYWGAVMTLAMLFRIEASVFLLFLPLALLFTRGKPFARRARLYLKANTALIALLVIGLLWHLWSPARTQVGRLLDPLIFLQQAAEQLSTGLAARAEVLEKALLNQYSSSYALTAVIVVMLTIIIAKTLEVLSIVYALLASHSMIRRLIPDAARAIGLWLIGLNLAVLTTFVIVRLFLQGRFVVPLALVFMLAVPFSLAALYDRWRGRDAKQRRWLFPAVCLALTLLAGDALFSFGPSKQYVKDAGLWLKQNTPPEGKVYSDSPVVAYYADNPGTDWLQPFSWEKTLDVIESGEHRAYRYLAIAVGRKNSDRVSLLSERLKRAPVARFTNERGDQVLIFAPS
ncbi:MAG TPA: glycosyltransferase family 39 protein [Burkholderiales bacterium]|nr:glycosyltransferase family 39 protein [Burkholderiales bacterium]